MCSSFVLFFYFCFLLLFRYANAYNVLRPLFDNHIPENINAKNPDPLFSFRPFVAWTSSTKRAQQLWRKCTTCYDSNREELNLDRYVVNQESRSFVALHHSTSLATTLSKDFSAQQIVVPSVENVHVCANNLSTLSLNGTVDEIKMLSHNYNILYILLLTTVLLSAINLFILLRFHILAKVSTDVINVSQSIATSPVAKSAEIFTPLQINKREVQPSNHTASIDHHNDSCRTISITCNNHRYGDNHTYSSPLSHEHPQVTDSADDAYLPVAAASIHGHTSNLRKTSLTNEYNSLHSPTSQSSSMKKCRAFYTAISNPSKLDRNFTSDNNIGDLSDIYGCIDEVGDNIQFDVHSEQHSEKALEQEDRCDSNIQLDITQLYGADNEDYITFEKLKNINDFRDMKQHMRSNSICISTNDKYEEVSPILSPLSSHGSISHSLDYEYIVEFDFSGATDKDDDDNCDGFKDVDSNQKTSQCENSSNYSLPLNTSEDPIDSDAVEMKKLLQLQPVYIDECQQIVEELTVCLSRLRATKQLPKLVINNLTADTPYYDSNSPITAILNTTRQLLSENQAYSAANISRALSSESLFSFSFSSNSNTHDDWMNNGMYYISEDDSRSLSYPTLTTNSSVTLCSNSSIEFATLSKHFDPSMKM